ncbi:MAG: hypothetical protein IJ418_02525 [Clostridia bacterium]|nr:hypothetical protein [Clostridia bacterium]
MKKLNVFKSFLILLLTLSLVLVLCGCAMPEIQTQNADGTLTVAGLLIEQVVTITARAIEAAVMIFAAWALKKFGQNAGMKNLTIAIQNVCNITRQTVGELNQTVVGKLKAGNKDGKLTADQMYELRMELYQLVKGKLDTATIDLITASGADLELLITGECESYLAMLKGEGIPSMKPAAEVPDEEEDEAGSDDETE